MHKNLEAHIKYWIREASDMGKRGFYFDEDLEIQSEDWSEFEKEAICKIDEEISNFT